MKKLLKRDTAANNRFWYLITGGVVFFILWSILARNINSLVLASPYSVMKELFPMLREKDFYLNLYVTFIRLSLIMLGAGVFGSMLAALAAFDKRLEYMIEPFRWFFMTFPPVIMIVVLMYCLGMGTNMILIFGASILWPIMYVNVLNAFDSIDYELIEMGYVYKISKINFFRYFIIPALFPAILSGAIQIVCNGVRVVILAEILGAHNGIGPAVSQAARNLESARLGAWILVVLLIAVILEFLILRPVQKKAYRWKNK